MVQYYRNILRIYVINVSEALNRNVQDCMTECCNVAARSCGTLRY